MGELHGENCVTLRTSIIGHELQGHHGLVDWFLRAESPTEGYTKAIFSGLTTYELSRVIEKFVLPNDALRGLWHVSAEPISKYDLVSLLNRVYGKKTDIRKNYSVILDRSLDSTRFRAATGYIPSSWLNMVETMHKMEGKQ